MFCLLSAPPDWQHLAIYHQMALGQEPASNQRQKQQAEHRVCDLQAEATIGQRTDHGGVLDISGGGKECHWEPLSRLCQGAEGAEPSGWGQSLCKA